MGHARGRAARQTANSPGGTGGRARGSAGGCVARVWHGDRADRVRTGRPETERTETMQADRNAPAHMVDQDGAARGAPAHHVGRPLLDDPQERHHKIGGGAASVSTSASADATAAVAAAAAAAAAAGTATSAGTGAAAGATGACAGAATGA